MEHLVIPDNQRHEAKGASTAGINTVCKANGDGTTSFELVNYSEIVGRPTVTGYQRVLAQSSAVTAQSPTATNTPIQVEFGTGQATANVTTTTAGLLTFNVAGQYQVTTFMRFGRVTGAGSAILFNRVLINGTQTLSSNSLMLNDASIIVPFVATLNITATAGMTMQWQVYRDSAGINDGGLLSQTPSLAGWAFSPSATLVVDKFTGASA